MAGGPSEAIQGTVIAVTRQYFLDNVAGWILELTEEGIPWKTTPPGWSRKPCVWPRKKAESKRHKTLSGAEW